MSFVRFYEPRNVRGEGGQVFDMPVYAATLSQLFELYCGYKLAYSLVPAALGAWAKILFTLSAYSLKQTSPLTKGMVAHIVS